RPRWSRPNQLPPRMPTNSPRLGKTSPRQVWAVGAWGATHGPMIARTTNRTMITAPMAAILLARSRRIASRHRLAPLVTSLVVISSASRSILSAFLVTVVTSVHPHSRVDNAVRDVDEEVDEDVDHRDEENEPDEHGVVTAVDRRADEGADAAEVEHGLGEHRAGQQAAGQQTDRRDHRQQRVAQHVTAAHHTLLESLGLRGPHVVLTQHLQHARPGHADDDGERDGR